jgi:malate dehydrogenase
MHKITIMGAGRVGEATAELLAIKELCRQVALIDVREGAAAGAALDIQESAGLFGFDTTVTGDIHNRAMTDSDMVIVTAGQPRKPGMSRSDVLANNLAIIDGIVDDIKRYAPQAQIMMVTNPVDVLTYHAWKRSGWARQRVFGLSGVLDAARMAAFVALETGFSAKDITTMVLGGHGDAMVPLPRFSTVNGLPLSEFLQPRDLERIVERTREGGAEILALKKTSSAYDAPAAAITTMVDAIVRDRKRILPSVAILDGEYGFDDIAMGVPCVLGAAGMERIVELSLNDDEKAQFARSAEGVQADLHRIAKQVSQ